MPIREATHEGRMRMSNLTQWSTPVELKDRATSARPALAHLNSTLCMAWRGINGNTIFVSTSQDNGQTWSPQRGLDTHTATNGPALAAFNGMFVMAWRGADGNGRRLRTS